MFKFNLSKFQEKIPIKLFERILKENLAVKDEKVLFIGDKGYGTTHLIAPIMTNAFSIAANNLGISNSTIYQNTKARNEDSDIVMLRELKNLPPKSVVVVNVSNRVGQLMYLGKSFRTFCKLRQHRFISAASLGMIPTTLFPNIVSSLDVNALKIHKEALKVKKILDNASKVNILTKKGTDLEIGIQNMKALIATGVYTEPGTGGNSIPAETYIPPAPNSVNGTVVIDGSIRTLNKTILCKDIVKMEIKKSLITSMNNSIESRQLQQSLIWANKNSKQPETTRKISELGIGLNDKAKIIGSTIIDEKAKQTAHVAIGSNSWFGGDIKSIIHLDQVFRDPIFKVDGRLMHLNK
ncbi:MAG: hypothetical protein AB7V77_01315 [Candidatus Woesearchaeota archaeon]